MKKHIHIGMDVGASAVKCIVLDTGGKILWRQYIHHDCRVVETVERVMTDLVAAYEGNEVFLCMTGQGGRGNRGTLWRALYTGDCCAVGLSVPFRRRCGCGD